MKNYSISFIVFAAMILLPEAAFTQQVDFHAEVSPEIDIINGRVIY